MTNGKVQPPEIRKGRVQIGIERTIQDKAFHSIVIRCHIDEEIEWSNMDEWWDKRKNWETVLVKRFKEMHDDVLQELGLEEKCAYVKPAKSYTADSDKLDAQLDDFDEVEDFS